MEGVFDVIVSFYEALAALACQGHAAYMLLYDSLRRCAVTRRVIRRICVTGPQVVVERWREQGCSSERTSKKKHLFSSVVVARGKRSFVCSNLKPYRNTAGGTISDFRAPATYVRM